jgi:hypothetical protein
MRWAIASWIKLRIKTSFCWLEGSCVAPSLFRLFDLILFIMENAHWKRFAQHAHFV